MNFFIDKENNVLFISLNQPVNEGTMQKIRDKFSEIDLPYKYVIVDNIYNITSV
jgi:hemerythrin-like domain-containing protein